MAKKHVVWQVEIGSNADERLRDRLMFHGRRYIAVWKLPVLATYIIECVTECAAKKRALKMASAAGIQSPRVRSLECLTHEFHHKSYPMEF